MTKTIEEAAWDFACNQWGKQVPNTIDKIADMLIDFGNELKAMPLSDRLTDEEREKIRTMRGDELGYAQCLYEKARSCSIQSLKQHHEVLCKVAVGRAALLKEIFGSDIFKEGE